MATAPKRRRVIRAAPLTPWPTADLSHVVCQFLLPVEIVHVRACSPMTRTDVDTRRLFQRTLTARLCALFRTYAGVDLPFPLPPWMALESDALLYGLGRSSLVIDKPFIWLTVQKHHHMLAREWTSRIRAVNPPLSPQVPVLAYLGLDEGFKSSFVPSRWDTNNRLLLLGDRVVTARHNYRDVDDSASAKGVICEMLLSDGEWYDLLRQTGDRIPRVRHTEK